MKVLQIVKLWFSAFVAASILGGTVLEMQRDEINQIRASKGKKPLQWWQGPHQASALWLMQRQTEGQVPK